MRPGPKLAAKAGAEKAGDDAHIFSGNAKHLRHHVLRVAHGLRGFVKGEVLAIQIGDGSVQFDGIVGLGGGGVGIVYCTGADAKAVSGSPRCESTAGLSVASDS